LVVVRVVEVVEFYQVLVVLQDEMVIPGTLMVVLVDLLIM
jgi:hypothetical protein